MDADEMREKLQNLETLVNKLLDKKSRLHNDDHETKRLHDLRERGINFLNSDNGGMESDSSHHSPGSWETTLYALSKELETICSRGSSPRDSPDTSPCLTPTNGMASITSTRRTFSVANDALPHQESLGEYNGYATPVGALLVRVRHEETEDRLDRGLSMICRHNSPQACHFFCGDADPEQAVDSRITRSSKLKYRDSSKYGIRFRLNLTGRDPDNITVSMNTEDHILRVFFDGEVIHLLQLAENTNPQTLSCIILDGITLFIKQRSKEMMCLEFEGSSDVNLPVVRQDESTLITTISLRIHSAISPEDVLVKTIDDTLMVRAGRSTDANGTVPTSGHFRVAMKLPEGTNSRSICSWMTKGQLTVRGRLIPTTRRMTCTF